MKTFKLTEELAVILTEREVYLIHALLEDELERGPEMFAPGAWYPKYLVEVQNMLNDLKAIVK